MRHEILIKDCTLAGASDLTVIAPIRKGFVPGLDAVTYKTRVQRVLRALHAGRSGLHEFELARMLSDAVERVGRIHSVRIAVLEPQDAVLLAVTFDGAWESYVRVIWQKVARLLDLIFCNTEDYVNGWESPFEVWGRWLRSRQAETSFLYAVPGLTVDDTVYLRAQERLARADANADLQATRFCTPSAEDIAARLFRTGQDPTTLPPGKALRPATEAQPAVFRQGLRALVGLHRLADLYPPAATGVYATGNTDGQLLQRAAHELLPEFEQQAWGGEDFLSLAWLRAQKRFGEQLRWFTQELPTPPARQPSLPPDPQPLPPDVQGGILEPYPDVDHGVVVLLGFASAADVVALLDAVTPTARSSQAQLGPGALACNIAFSLEGLRVAGLTDAEVDTLPAEFVQGMQRRAGVLGDLRMNHPRRWRLPVRNWHLGINAPDPAAGDPGERVPMDAVHAVLQLRRIRILPPQPSDVARTALQGELQRLLGSLMPGIRVLSLQWVHRLHSGGGAGARILEHFGFEDGASDPVLAKAQSGAVYPNHVHLGEALVGHPNAADVKAPSWPAGADWTQQLFHDGSFLVIRKLRQDLGVLEEVLAKSVEPAAGLDRDTVLAKMMGRWPHGNANAGKPLAQMPPNPLNANDFAFARDPEGALCPLHSHIRRGNPRTLPVPPQSTGSRPPRLFRRSLSYGPAFDPTLPLGTAREAALCQERGLVFMAYNASLGEQFEVVQRWLSGGNSTGGFSGHGDPFLGVPEPGRPRRYRFEHASPGGPQTARIALDGEDDLLAEPRPLVRLEWGGYFFTPSLPGLQLLRQRAAKRAAEPAAEPIPWSVKEGEAAIAALRRIEREQGAQAAAIAWKAALEDPQAAADFRTASIWAAIRKSNGGILRTPYGVLVADPVTVGVVLQNPAGTSTPGGYAVRPFTSTGYLPRMRQSFGAIYLGMDPGDEQQRYEKESAACNAAIMALADTPAKRQTVFGDAMLSVAAKLDELVTDARRYAQEDEQLRLADGAAPPREHLSWEVTLDVRELIDELLADCCERWFGLDATHPDPEAPLMRRTGFRWTWAPGEPPSYPGHFMAPSRYIFQPHPGPEVEKIGINQGRAMVEAMHEFLREQGSVITAPVTRAVLDSPPSVTDLELAARNVVGALMGMIPTVDGNLRRVCDRWLGEGILWSLRAGLREEPDPAVFRTRVSDAFLRTMQSRVVPDTLWRTVQHGMKLGTAPHEEQFVPGDLVVAGLASAAQQGVEQGGPPDVAVAFGGDRGGASHPTHACPGYHAALEMMEGFVAALVRSPLPLQPGPAPLTLTVRGEEAYAAPEAVPGVAGSGGAVSATAAAAAILPPASVPGPRIQRSLLVTSMPRAASTVWTYGDSWLAEGVADRSSLSEALGHLGCTVNTAYSHRSRTLKNMASGINVISNALRQAQVGEVQLLVVGGGGNDVTDSNDPGNSTLFDLLVDGATTVAGALDPLKVSAFIDQELQGYYATVLQELLDATRLLQIPILVHAYADPIPDGRGPRVVGIPVGNAWLKPVFSLRNMADNALNTDVMRELIGRLNAMVQNVVNQLNSLGDPRLQHLDLRGKVDDRWNAQGTYKRHWEDELHPNRIGFDILAQATLDAVARALITPVQPVPGTALTPVP